MFNKMFFVWLFVLSVGLIFVFGLIVDPAEIKYEIGFVPAARP